MSAIRVSADRSVAAARRLAGGQRRLPFIKLTSKVVRFPKADVDAVPALNFRVRAFGLETGEKD